MANVIQIVIRQSGEGSAIVDANKALGGMKGVGDTAISTLLGVGKALTGVGAIAATALIGFAASGVKAAMDVDHQLAQIAATLGTTKDAAMPLKDLMTELALDPKLTVNVTQAGEAIEVLAANGLELEEILAGGARGAVQLANATGSDFATAATIATDAMQQFGFEANQLETVADGIAGVLVKSKFSADDYALALSNAGGIAGSLGVELSDFNTVLAATSSQFSSGSDAGTSFKTLLTRLAKPTDEVAAAMQQYGLEIFDAEGKMKPFAEIAGQLNKVFNDSFTVTTQVGGATKEMTKAAEAASAKIGDLSRDIGLNNDKLTIMQQELASIVAKQGDSSTAAQNKRIAIQKLTNTITDQNEKLNDYRKAISAVDGAQARTITSTNKLTEEQKAALATTLGGTDAMRTILSLSDMTEEQFIALSAEVNKSGLASQAAATRVDSLTGAWEIFKGIIEAVQIQVGDKFLPIIRRVTEAVSVWASENSGQVVAFFGVIASGIDSVITKGTELFNAFQTSGLGGLALALGIPPDVLAGITAATDELQRLKDVFAGGAEEGGAGGGFSALLGEIDFAAMAGKILEGIPEALTSITEGIATHLRENVPDFQEAMSEWSGKFWEWTSTAVTGAAVAMGAVILAISTWVMSSEGQAQMMEIGASIGRNLLGALKLIGENSNDYTEIMMKIGGALLLAIPAIAGTLIVVGASIVAGIAHGIIESMGVEFSAATFSELGPILSGIVKNEGIILKKVGADIVKAINDGLIAALQAGMKLGDGIKEKLNEARDMVSDWQQLGADFMTGLLEGIQQNAGSVLEFLKSLVQNSLDQFGLGWAVQSPSKKTVEFGRNFIEGLIVGADDMAPGFQDRMKSIAEMAVKGMAEGIAEATPDVADKMHELANAATTTLSGDLLIHSPSEVFDRFGRAIPQGLAGGINSAAGLATQAIEGMGRNLLTSTSSSLSFIDDLDMGGLARGFGTGGGQWRNFRNILKNEIMGGMGALADGTADVMDSVYKVAARFNFPPGMAAEFAEANGLVEHLTGNFEKFRQEMNIQNLGNLTQMAASFSGLGSTFADMLTQQMAGGEGAIKTMEAYRKLTGEIGTQETQMATLQEELEALNAATERDTAAIEKKQKAIEKLTGEMEKNQKAIVATRENYAALQAQAFDLFSGSQTEAQRVGSELATIALLEDFLRSGDSSFLIPSDAVSQAAGITGILYDQISGQAELNRLVAEQAEREALITEQKEAQQKLDFLKSQIDLLKMGQELGGNLLDGINFGLGASVGDMLAAANAIAMALVDQIDHDLGIASPSKLLFDKFKNQIGGAMVGGLLAVRPMMEGAIQPILNPIMQGANAAGKVVNNYFNQTVNTRADSSSVIGDFRTMQLMAG